MLNIDQQSYDALSVTARQGYVRKLAQDLYERYPERFLGQPMPQMEAYVEYRIDYAQRFEITRGDCVADLMFIESDSMADFPGRHSDGWWAPILEEDVDQEHKIRRLWTVIGHIEVHPGFQPVFD